MADMTCFSRIGMDVPTTPGDCLCGEFVRFDLVNRRTEHFLVCPVVDEIVASGVLPDDVDEGAVLVGMEVSDAGNQDRRSRRAQPRPQESVGEPA